MLRLAIACALVATACGSDHSGPDAQVLTGDVLTLSWGPKTIDNGIEGTQCIWLRLSNDGPVKIHQLHNTLSTISHHLIVYKDDKDTTEQTTPVDCQPFTGALNTSGLISPIMITQRMDDLLTLPDGVAYSLAPHQMIKIEMHYLNATEAPVPASATVQLYVANEATIHDDADLLFIGSPDISIPPGQSATVHQFFHMPTTIDLSASHVFAITGHTHRLGTTVKVAVAPSDTGPQTSVYAPDPFVWSEPVTTIHDPGFGVPTGGGFDFECDYYNNTSATVKFGESANAEMCFFWAYYYPSQGAKVCFHSDDYGNIDLCCPGDSSCSFIESVLGI